METVAQIITAAVAVVALFLIWLQLRYQSKQMKFDALTQLHQELMGPRMQAALRFVYAKQPNDLANPKSRKELEMIETVLIAYDLIGFRVKQGVIPEDATLETEWMILLRAWPRLEPFIRKERRFRGNVPYKEHFEWLVRRAEIFKKRRYPGVEPKIHQWEFGEVTQNSKPCVGVFVLKNNNQVLLVQRRVEPFKGYWDIPGGFLEVGEHPEAGAIREIQEETGYEIEPTEILGIFMDVYGPNQDRTLNICYVGKITGGIPEAGSDATKISWFPIEALPENIAFEWSKEALRLLKRRVMRGNAS